MIDTLRIRRGLILATMVACAACGAPATSTSGGGCTPACSPGFTCQGGACLALCNPRCNAGYTCIIEGGETRCVTSPDAGTVDGAVDVASTDASTTPRTDVTMTTDPRPPEERACPGGARLRVQLWDVYAMPRQPDGSPWDGVSAGTRELFCRVASAIVTEAIERALNGQFPGTGEIFERFVRAQVEAAIAEVCGLSATWLQERFEGPDMFARAAENGTMLWQTPAVQDNWRAPLRTTTRGTPTEWTALCRSGTRSQLDVFDEDIAFDDAMGSARFSLGDLTPQMICGGWVLLRPFGGVASTVLRIQVDGAGQNCEGLLPTRMAEVTLPRAPRLFTPGDTPQTRGAER